MNRDVALQKLEDCVNSDDPAVAHREADEVLCELLRTLGYADVVDAYEDVRKWYE